jgi:hypothetical protein
VRTCTTFGCLRSALKPQSGIETIFAGERDIIAAKLEGRMLQLQILDFNYDLVVDNPCSVLVEYLADLNDGRGMVKVTRLIPGAICRVYVEMHHHGVVQPEWLFDAPAHNVVHVLRFAEMYAVSLGVPIHVQPF